MAKVLSANEVLTQLRELGDDTNVRKQLYKSQIDGAIVVLYDAQGAACEVKASYVEDYVKKGFTTAPPADAVDETAPETPAKKGK